MRKAFRHAASERAVAEPLIIEVELSNGATGYGETHPRPYVSGETLESAAAVIRDDFVPRLVELRAESFPEALEAIDALPPAAADGKTCTAARASVELALIDAFARGFRRSLEEAAGWLGLPGLGSPGSLRTVRYSGVVGGESPEDVVRSIRRMRCIRLRDFKIKVGDARDDDRIRAAVRALGSSLSSGRTTLRLDANGGWTLDEARKRLAAWVDLPVTCVEQPLPKGQEDAWYQLLGASRIGLMADESLVTADDAEMLLRHRAATWFNIRISKNGGLLPALRLAALAQKRGIHVQLGCMVGETSILSAAGRWFLQLAPGVKFAEGSFGRFLLRGDVTRRPIRFGWGGRAAPPDGPGFGVTVEPELLRRFSVAKPQQFAL